jgi:hypothetical protein
MISVCEIKYHRSLQHFSFKKPISLYQSSHFLYLASVFVFSQDQCREDGPVPPNCSAVTTHASGWLCMSWRHRVAIRRLFAATQVVIDELPPQQVGDEIQLVMCLLVAEI